MSIRTLKGGYRSSVSEREVIESHQQLSVSIRQLRARKQTFSNWRFRLRRGLH